MRVVTPIADMDITIDTLRVEGGALVMENAAKDAVRTRAVLAPRDVRVLFGAILRPSVIWFAITCLFRSDEAVSVKADTDFEDHPTSNPW